MVDVFEQLYWLVHYKGFPPRSPRLINDRWLEKEANGKTATHLPQ